MNEIMTLRDLESVVGKDGVTRLFTEYLMTMTGKADKLDEVRAVVNNNGTLEDIKGLL